MLSVKKQHITIVRCYGFRCYSTALQMLGTVFWDCILISRATSTDGDTSANHPNLLLHGATVVGISLTRDRQTTHQDNVWGPQRMCSPLRAKNNSSAFGDTLLNFWIVWPLSPLTRSICGTLPSFSACVCMRQGIELPFSHLPPSFGISPTHLSIWGTALQTVGWP